MNRIIFILYMNPAKNLGKIKKDPVNWINIFIYIPNYKFLINYIYFLLYIYFCFDHIFIHFVRNWL